MLSGLVTLAAILCAYYRPEVRWSMVVMIVATYGPINAAWALDTMRLVWRNLWWEK
jgi:hypothetical protein